MRKVIIEVGSSSTKVDLQEGEQLKHLKTVTILFKKNYQIEKKLRQEDIEKLIDTIKEYQKQCENLYVCGTSIFRGLDKEQKQEFLDYFQQETGLTFDIIPPEKENELTVLGATRKVKEKVAVMVGGGGSTEIAIYQEGICEMINTPVGVVDAMLQFPDLCEDLPTTNLETVKQWVKENLKLPKEKADILILAGGGHLYFALHSGFHYEKNTWYKDEKAPIRMALESRKKDTMCYYKVSSLDEIRSRVEDPNWWFATRAMCAFVLVIAEEIGAKYIVPTDISMADGLVYRREERK